MTNDRKPSTQTSAIVIGGGGALGSAVLEQLLASRGFERLQVLVTQGFRTAVGRLDALVVASFDDATHDAQTTAEIAHTALLIFDRARHANGRENAFVRPQPEQLPRLAQWLHRRGVRHLVVVLPHDPFGLPEALKRGLANLDEHSVAALGFEHVVLLRSSQTAAPVRAERWLQRLADGVLAQLRIMLPATQQPVRVRKVAQLAAEVALQLPRHPPGTRVLPPELVWQAAQLADCEALVHDWLAGARLPAAPDTRATLMRL